jgi:hypothetical protein
MKQIWNFLDGKKRTIATIGGVLLTWAWKYQVAPEQYLDLANMIYTAFGLTAVGHAISKGKSAQ